MKLHHQFHECHTMWIYLFPKGYYSSSQFQYTSMSALFLFIIIIIIIIIIIMSEHFKSFCKMMHVFALFIVVYMNLLCVISISYLIYYLMFPYKPRPSLLCIYSCLPICSCLTGVIKQCSLLFCL